MPFPWPVLSPDLQQPRHRIIRVAFGREGRREATDGGEKILKKASAPSAALPLSLPIVSAEGVPVVAAVARPPPTLPLRLEKFFLPFIKKIFLRPFSTFPSHQSTQARKNSLLASNGRAEQRKVETWHMKCENTEKKTKMWWFMWRVC